MKILDNSIKIALSLNGTEPINIYSFLYRNNRLVSVGRNNMRKTDKKVYEIGRKFNIQKFMEFSYLHSEIDCLRRPWENEELTGKEKLVIVRFTKKLIPALAKPCPSCHSFLSALNIRDVYYTSYSGWQYLNGSTL